jgi:hypothetical protein
VAVARRFRRSVYHLRSSPIDTFTTERAQGRWQ